MRMLPDFKPDWKEPARIVDRKAFAEFYATAPPFCQLCGEAGFVRGLSIHHCVSKGQGGDDVPANFSLVCGHGSAGCHGDIEARRGNARSRLRVAMTDEQIAYVDAKKGRWWLDKNYPLA